MKLLICSSLQPFIVSSLLDLIILLNGISVSKLIIGRIIIMYRCDCDSFWDDNIYAG
jgi:hypothetical protein